MKIMILLIFTSFGAGLFSLLCGLLRLPTLRTGRAMSGAGKKERPLADVIEGYCEAGAAKFAGLVRMNEYKRARLEKTLKAAGSEMTPEEFQARAVLKAGAWTILIPPALWLLPLLAVPLLVLVVLTYLKETGSAEEALREKREAIEGEAYRFASTITQELKNGRDVLSMLERYKRNAGEAFRRELDMLCADMRSGSYEAALTRFEARVGSAQISDVTRGLIGVIRGDDGGAYFQMLTRDFKEAELRRLKAKAAKIPPKVRIFSLAMLMCYLATFFVIIIYEIINSMGSMF
ncbi:MAG: type II secretion system F family protein [Lachnospiraceae bacterium]|nr:type II secretion system F family protein [Lachnospiraceae bacterium]